MGEEIFRHTDRDGDVIRLERATGANPLLRAYVDSENEFALLDRDAVLSLIQALTEWAYPTHTPEGPNRSLIEELIAKAAKNAVSAVLPLHLSSFATQMQAAEDKIERVANALLSDPEPCSEPLRMGQILMETHEECGFLWVTHRPEAAPEADPEPGDVGHPRPPLPVRKQTIVPECGLCKQPWSDGHGQPGDPCPGVESARQHPFDWTEALWRVKPEPADESRYCDECGHSWESYRPELGQCASIKGKAICGCTRRPA